MLVITLQKFPVAGECYVAIRVAEHQLLFLSNSRHSLWKRFYFILGVPSSIVSSQFLASLASSFQVESISGLPWKCKRGPFKSF